MRIRAEASLAPSFTKLLAARQHGSLRTLPCIQSVHRAQAGATMPRIHTASTQEPPLISAKHRAQAAAAILQMRTCTPCRQEPLSPEYAQLHMGAPTNFHEASRAGGSSVPANVNVHCVKAGATIQGYAPRPSECPPPDLCEASRAGGSSVPLQTRTPQQHKQVGTAIISRVCELPIQEPLQISAHSECAPRAGRSQHAQTMHCAHTGAPLSSAKHCA